MEASGRGRVMVNQLSKVFGAAGIALILVTVGLMVWDILFSSEYVIKTVTRDAVVAVAASVGGAMLGEVVGAAIATELAGVEASALFVVLAGLVTGFIGAFLPGAFAGWLAGRFDIWEWGLPLQHPGESRCYVAPMPDGEKLARQIAHQEISNLTH